VIPNIETKVNDRMIGTYDDGINPLVNLSITIPKGLYNIDQFNATIVDALANLGTLPTAPPLFEITGNDSTQKVTIVMNYLTTTIDLTIADSPRILMGFNSQVLGPNITAPQDFIADETANFNTINFLHIHSDLTDNGIPINQDTDQTVAVLGITVEPGTQLVYQPFHIAQVDCNNLINGRRKKATFWITDQSGNQLDMNGEYWTTRMAIIWDMPHVYTTQGGGVVGT
jgi:hypothetical protein